MEIQPMEFTTMKKNLMSIIQRSLKTRQSNYTNKQFKKVSSNSIFPVFPTPHSAFSEYGMQSKMKKKLYLCTRINNLTIFYNGEISYRSGNSERGKG